LLFFHSALRYRTAAVFFVFYDRADTLYFAVANVSVPLMSVLQFTSCLHLQFLHRCAACLYSQTSGLASRPHSLYTLYHFCSAVL